ncbi:MAG: hypothetical protein MK116_11060 [Phycisphaerales bacterium]|nr:hypothetical protein [Phycisphaerales bacterium]
MRRLTAFLLLLAMPTLAGCYRPLFDEQLPRNQFAQHDQAHGVSAPMEKNDAFGSPQPALRERLMKD